MTDTFNPECQNCQITIERLNKWFDHIGCTPKKYQRYEKLLGFVKRLAFNTACHECDVSHDAFILLKEIGEYEPIKINI